MCLGEPPAIPIANIPLTVCLRPSSMLLQCFDFGCLVSLSNTLEFSEDSPNPVSPFHSAHCRSLWLSLIRGLRDVDGGCHYVNLMENPFNKYVPSGIATSAAERL